MKHNQEYIPSAYDAEISSAVTEWIYALRKNDSIDKWVEHLRWMLKKTGHVCYSEQAYHTDPTPRIKYSAKTLAYIREEREARHRRRRLPPSFVLLRNRLQHYHETQGCDSRSQRQCYELVDRIHTFLLEKGYTTGYDLYDLPE